MQALWSLLLMALCGTSVAFAPLSPSSTTTAAGLRRLMPSSLSMTVKEVDTKDVIKVGVIGMGRIGLVHLEAITKAPGVTPVIVSNPTISKAEAGTSLVGSCRCYCWCCNHHTASFLDLLSPCE
jgi:hypothetical protein